MTNEYLLPCSCGQANRISIRQAGETITCVCGSQLEVPTMRQVRQLEPVAERPGQGQAVWGRRQGLVFLGLVLTVASLTTCGIIWLAIMPATPDLTMSAEHLQEIPTAEVWRYWTSVRDGMPNYPIPEMLNLLAQMRRARIAMQVALGIAVVGLALVAGGLLAKPRTA